MSRYPHQLAHCQVRQYVYWWGAANLKKRKRKRREKKEKDREKGKEKGRKEYRTVLCKKNAPYSTVPTVSGNGTVWLRMWSHRPWGRMHVTHESGRSSAILTPSQLIFFCIVSLEADHRAGENFAASEENMVARNPVNLPFFSSWSGCAVEALVL